MHVHNKKRVVGSFSLIVSTTKEIKGEGKKGHYMFRRTKEGGGYNVGDTVLAVDGYLVGVYIGTI